MRTDGRAPNALRPVKITPHYLLHPPGSCLIEMGNTRVVCSVSIEDGVPSFLKGTARGWLSAEYAMIPGSSDTRINRDRYKVKGRTQEIQRLIGRSLRGCIEFAALGERTVQIDCDVLDADGGTRTAAVTGGYVALALALRKLEGKIPTFKKALKLSVAAVSVGIVGGSAFLDLNYEDDKAADVDMNIVRTSEGKYIEIQGTAEAQAFSREELDGLLKLADQGISELLTVQQKILKG